MAQKFYAVKEGKLPGIYRTWDECKAQVHGYPGALYKSFSTADEAQSYIGGSAPQAVDTEQGYHIYVDGSYVNQRYSWGFAVYLDGRLDCTKNGVGTSAEAAKLHNVAGEIEGTVQAVLWGKAQGVAQITIHHDYIGISEWAEKRWKTNNDVTKQYAAFMEPHLSWVQFKKVPGHAGIAGNELADQLAKAALGIN